MRTMVVEYLRILEKRAFILTILTETEDFHEKTDFWLYRDCFHVACVQQ